MTLKEEVLDKVGPNLSSYDFLNEVSDNGADEVEFEFDSEIFREITDGVTYSAFMNPPPGYIAKHLANFFLQLIPYAKEWDVDATKTFTIKVPLITLLSLIGCTTSRRSDKAMQFMVDAMDVIVTHLNGKKMVAGT